MAEKVGTGLGAGALLFARLPPAGKAGAEAGGGVQGRRGAARIGGIGGLEGGGSLGARGKNVCTGESTGVGRSRGRIGKKRDGAALRLA
jgi:hypothetical protein